MRRPSPVRYSWKGAAEQLDRLAKASARADELWLRSLSIEESARVLEDLCQGIPELEASPEEDPPPVVLFRIWRYPAPS